MKIKTLMTAQYTNTKFHGKTDKLFSKPDELQNLKKLPLNPEFYSKYKNIDIKNIQLDVDKIKKLGIPNLQLVDNKGFRGESLSADRNYKFLPLIKKYGIDTVVDLRTADYTNKYKEKCNKFGLKYLHIPIDAKTVPDREIIDNLPLLFKTIENGNFYIACAQGKHRTDIAIAMNYLFNPKYKGAPPVMHGHVENGKMRIQDIFTRANSVYKNLTPQDKSTLGWNKEFDEAFKIRKNKLVEFNEQ